VTLTSDAAIRIKSHAMQDRIKGQQERYGCLQRSYTVDKRAKWKCADPKISVRCWVRDSFSGFGSTFAVLSVTKYYAEFTGW